MHQIEDPLCVRTFMRKVRVFFVVVFFQILANFFHTLIFLHELLLLSNGV